MKKKALLCDLRVIFVLEAVFNQPEPDAGLAPLSVMEYGPATLSFPSGEGFRAKLIFPSTRETERRGHQYDALCFRMPSGINGSQIAAKTGANEDAWLPGSAFTDDFQLPGDGEPLEI